MYVYGSLAYLEKATPIVTMQDLKNHPFIGYVEELLFGPELSFAEAIEADIEPRIRSTSVLAQLHATLSGSGLCVLPAFAASSYPILAPAVRTFARTSDSSAGNDPVGATTPLARGSAED
jgi:DNA-binding transcriptional LysR family regulator